MTEALQVQQIDLTGELDGVPELVALAALQARQLPVAPLLLVPGRIEKEFYLSNNLAPQLRELFTGLHLEDPDEDELEDVSPAAVRLIEQNYLLDEVVDGFYEAVSAMPRELRIRRPGSGGRETLRGRPSLLDLKRTWAQDWTVEALFRRLTATGSVDLAERPVLLHAADEPAGAALLRSATAVLGREVMVWTAGGMITRLAL
jgi:hypothetical protein